MMTSYFNLLKYAKTGIASPDMTYYDRMRASTLMGGVVKALTGIPPLTFKADGTPLISWSMKGNGSQTGTPTPDNPVMPEFVGTLSGSDWTIPITCAGQTTPVYLGEVTTVRRIRKLVLDGTENWALESTNMFTKPNEMPLIGYSDAFCDRYVLGTSYAEIYASDCTFGLSRRPALFIHDNRFSTVATFKSYLQQQYAAGTPATVWYVLAEPETGIVNEPLCKIGDYADELSSTDAAVTIPTAKGNNVLTIDTDLQPSEMTITFKG